MSRATIRIAQIALLQLLLVVAFSVVDEPLSPTGKAFGATGGVRAGTAASRSDPRLCAHLAARRGAAKPDRLVVVAKRTRLTAVVDANPAGTTFCLRAGVHRLGTGVVPKSSDVFVGESGAVLSGAKDISSAFAASGGVWVAAAQAQRNPAVFGTCVSGSACQYADDVFFDNRPLTRVLSQAEVGAGKFYFDYGAQKIWIGDNPAGHLVEAAVATRAFKGWGSGADNVSISGLVVEKFANEASIAAINGRGNWTVTGNEVRLNHGVGIQDAGTIRNNFVHDNGQMGVSGSNSSVATVVEGNEIARNNYAGFDPNWEAGGGKWTKTSHLTVRNNYVHDNKGVGLWTDTDNTDTTYTGNRVENNSNAGIFHEVSYNAIISNNTVKGNGLKIKGWLDNAGILVNSSSHVEIKRNKVSRNGGGIGLVQAQRNSGSYLLSDIYVHDNAITMVSTGRTGLVQEGNDQSIFKSRGIRFLRNSYVVGCQRDPFAWASHTSAAAYAYVTPWEWVAAGNDPGIQLKKICR